MYFFNLHSPIFFFSYSKSPASSYLRGLLSCLALATHWRLLQLSSSASSQPTGPPMSNTPPSQSHEQHLPTRHPSPPPPPSRHYSKYNFFSSIVPQWKGAKPLPFIISIAIGLLLNFAVPKPHQLSKKAWQLLAIFLTTITGLVLGPLPVGAWAVTCLTIVVITKTLTFAAAFSAFTNEVIWLIVASFFFSRGFVKTGLGERLAMIFVRWLGKSTLGLSYGLVLSEAAISPAMPSTTARAGGIFLPIIKSLAEASDSRPKDESSRKLGAFLVQSQLQVIFVRVLLAILLF